jgi:hypothetical protein
MTTDEMVASYGAAWNEPDEAKRRALLMQSWSDEGHYMDPTGSAAGRDALIQHIGGFQATMPGHTIEMTSGVDVYGNVFRFAWEMRNDQGVALEGMDFGEIADDGRISRIMGFFGPFPSAAD